MIFVLSTLTTQTKLDRMPPFLLIFILSSSLN